MKMYDKLVNIIFILLFVIFCIFTILFIYDLMFRGSFSQRGLEGFILSLFLTLATLFCMIKGNDKVKRLFLFIIYIFIIIEVFFQILAIFGKIPGINIAMHVPYGRIYWTEEGFENSIMNRYGWHYPEFKLKSDSKRIVLIGDSFIQATQVKRNQNVGVILEELINKNSNHRFSVEVLSLGIQGAGPAQYLEILKYSIKYFKPNQVIIFTFSGNDFKNVCPETNYNIPLDKYIHYFKGKDGNLKIYPESKKALTYFRNKLEFNHKNFFVNGVRILGSHCLTVIVLKHVIAKTIKKVKGSLDDKSGEVHMVGGDENIKDDACDAITIATGLLKMCQQYAASHSVSLHIVTIPHFSKVFYSKHHSDRWVLEDDESFYERSLINFAQKNDIPILPMGKHIHDRRLSVNTIKNLYFLEGRGHLTRAGHQYFANAVYDYFYSKDK